jgi:hypothetical protein
VCQHQPLPLLLVTSFHTKPLSYCQGLDSSALSYYRCFMARKNPHAVALGKKGGKKGGKARWVNLTPEQRSEIARKAVQARWARVKAKKSTQGEA